MRRLSSCLVSLLLLCFAASAIAVPEVIVGNVRIQFLSPTLVRIEQKGREGFENRNTFTVVDRKWPGTPFTKEKQDAAASVTGVGALFSTRNYMVVVPDGSSLDGVSVTSAAGVPIYAFHGTLPKAAYLPAPGTSDSYVLADSPRIVPSKWGSTPDPKAEENSGWDLNNDAPDIYVFVNPGKGNATIRSEYLKLTGPTELPPLWEFGFTNSRYNPYTEASALEELDEYRSRQIPLDTFVIDTDWRIGGSHGYDVAKNLFPDMDRFLKEVHNRHAHTMFNDHPEPVAATALDPKEMQYRWDGLTGMLARGVDAWWYDRNWGTHIQTPAEGLPLEVWGMSVYHDITARFRPDVRPLIMTNAFGIDNGRLHQPPPAPEHRYPVWWTGDTTARWEFLRYGVANGINQGVDALVPYVNEDLGGHVGRPTPELYVRYLQYGCLSPVTRVHCTRGQDRLPWTYGPEAEKIVTDAIKLRYRLLPTIYAAAHRNFVDGTPLLRRGDIEWPQYPEAKSDTQFLLGDDLLVAPILKPKDGESVGIASSFFGRGLKAEYFANENLQGEPVVTRTDPKIDFDWGYGSPDPKVPDDHFSARWTGTLGPVPVTGDYTLTTTTDDGVRLWLDGKQLIDKWIPQDSVANSVTVHLEAGQSYPIRVEFLELTGQAICHLSWKTPSDNPTPNSSRQVWIPPGEWQNLWTGTRTVGPGTIDVSAPLSQIPLFARVGGLILLAPDMQYTTEKPWDPITIEAFVGGKQPVERTLYEDDGVSPKYKKGAFATTTVRMEPLMQGHLRVTISGRKGRFEEMPSKHGWVIRLHVSTTDHEVWTPSAATVNGKEVQIARAPASGDQKVLGGPGAVAGERETVFEVTLPAADAGKGQVIEIIGTSTRG